MMSAITYPTTLDSIGGDKLLWHVLAEHNGYRYHLGCSSDWGVAYNIAIRYTYRNHPKVAYFLTDKSDSTIIHGGSAEFDLAMQETCL